MRQTTTATHAAPVDEAVDAEVLEFRANFEASSPLDELVREGARRMLQAAIDAEVDEFIVQLPALLASGLQSTLPSVAFLRRDSSARHRRSSGLRPF
ncbi:MAG: hypothetical protein R3B91_14860 [Planctomycetaceae bacterium]